MRSSEIDSTDTRYIDLQGIHENTESPFPDNSITSSRYTKFNFLPKSLILQFSSPFKLWFLLISILELIQISDISISYGTVLPLALLVLIDLIKEGYLDFIRHVSDKKINSQCQKVWDGAQFIEKECKNIHVGDIVLLENKEISPADMIILCVGNEEHECYADVSAVIGESNLKIKHPIKEIQNKIENDDKIESLDCMQASNALKELNGELVVSQPNKYFKHFTGKVRFPNNPRAAVLDNDNLLLRGMKIVNTPWIFGFVIYTGVETKVWINNLIRPAKVSQVRKILNSWLLWMFPIILIISVTNTIIFQFFPIQGYSWYEIFFSNIILFNHMIQISLFLSIELIKILLEVLNAFSTSYSKANSVDLLPNLGMIEYIVTDKTGTLTENILDIALFVINKKLYFNDDNFIDPEKSSRNNSTAALNSLIRVPDSFSGEYHSFKELIEEFSSDSDNSKFLNFFTCLAICNLAFPEDDDFVAISVDDKVLARTAANFGVRVVSRDSENCLVNVLGNDVSFEVLGTQAFSSDIKKSRIVVKNTLDNEVIMFVKGFRESMINIYDPSTYSRENLEDAIIRYRTLFLGLKKMNEKEAQQFKFDYETAQLSPVNRQGRVENVFQNYEKGLEFLGIVGLEDVVTDDTKKSVELLKQAGIKFWVLSGDSEESTLTASIAAGVFRTEFRIIRLVNFSSELDCMNILQSSIRENIYPENFHERPSVDEDAGLQHNIIPARSDAAIPQGISVASVMSVEDMIPTIARRQDRRSTLFVREATRRSTVHPLISKLSLFKRKQSLEGEFNPKNLKFILSVDSSGLEYGTSSKEHLKYFTALLFTAKAVCFHSLLPDQKTKVVRLVKNNFRFSPIVMSVGDGISDIGMIQEADIGIGIESSEGKEVTLSADVSIKKFHQLTELILIDGHRRYVQLSKMILLCFYVMILLEVEMVIYNPVSGWTGQSILQKEFLVVYRLVVNIMPIVGLCLMDRDSSSTFISVKAYRSGIFNSLLTKRNLASYVVTGLLQGSFTYLCTHLFFSKSIAYGKTEDMVLVGSSVFFIMSTTVFVSIFVETYAISLKVILIYLFCMAVQILSSIPLAYTENSLIVYTDMIIQYESIWFYLIFTTLFNVSICYCFKAVRYLFYPDIIEKVRTAPQSNSIQLDSRLGQYKKTLKSVYKENVIWKHRSNFDDTSLNYSKLKFISKYRENMYQADKIAESSQDFRILLLIGGISVCIYSIYSLTALEASASAIGFHIGFSIISLLSYFIPSLPNYLSYSLIYLVCNYTFIQIFYLISQIAFGFACLPMVTYLPVLYLIGFSNFWYEMTLLVISSNIISAIISVYTFSSDNGAVGVITIETIVYCIIYLCICLTASLVSYQIEQSKRLEFVLVQKVNVEIRKTKSVLSYLMPAFVTKRVQDGVRYISDYQGIVSVIFCDIHNFESILTSYNAQELTALLDEVFGKFDQICMLSGCTKIETVGKTYMACAGLKDSETEIDPYYSSVSHARRCIEMGLAIIRSAEKIVLRGQEVLKFNIGINSGPVTAGVVGLHKPQFSLVGDTVNTASRMASLCPKANCLQISKDTFDLLTDKTGLIFDQSQVNAKGKGIMKTYLVSVPQADSATSPSKTRVNSTLFSEKSSRHGKSKTTKKATLYQFNNLHSDNDKRRSSMLDELEAEVANEESDFVRKETEKLQNVTWFSVGCKETKKETKFRLETSEATYPIARFGMILRVISNGLLLIVSIVEYSLYGLVGYDEILRLVLEALVVAVIVVKFKAYFKSIWYSWAISLICLIGAVFRFGSSSLDSEIIFVSYIYHLLQAAHCSQLLFNNFNWAGLSVVLVHLTYSIIMRPTNWLLQILASVIFYFILLFTIYTREQKLRYFVTLKGVAEKKLKDTEELLVQMMPKHVFESLKEHHTVTENISKVTILYADIVGFTQWASDKRPEEVVNMLWDLFTEFDRKCVEYGVYKVHTIGDCYVAMGYTGIKPRAETSECYRLAKFALALIKIIETKNKENGTSLNMRIGMHTGDIHGGIAGTNIVRYDIYGIDVYIANKMESNGKAGCVKVSETSWKILHDNWPMTFVFNRDEDVYVPITNSRMRTYFLELNPSAMTEESSNF